MLSSILITGGNAEKRKEKALLLANDFLDSHWENNPDFHLIEGENSIKIAQIRELKGKLSLKPFSSLTTVTLIDQAEKMTIPAQNSLLKILEEPPESSRFILTAPNPKSLLPTIVSRCQLVRIEQTSQDPEEGVFATHCQFLQEMIGATPGQRILLSEKYSQNNQEVLDFCQNQIRTLRKLLYQEVKKEKNLPLMNLTPRQMTKILRSLQKALFLLKSNINPRLLLENLLISYPI